MEKIKRRHNIKGDLRMGRKLMMTTVALGTAYLLRNKKSRDKLKEQFRDFASMASRR